MLRKFAGLGLAVVFTIASGCSQRLPLEEAGDPAPPPAKADAFAEISTPLELTSFEVVASGGGYRGVFLRLTRFPEAISYSDSENPGRIVIDIQGPTGTESPEESFPGRDNLVSKVRVSRSLGNLRIILDLAAAEPPDYSVHRMADWVMVRMRPPGL